MTEIKIEHDKKDTAEISDNMFQSVSERHEEEQAEIQGKTTECGTAMETKQTDNESTTEIPISENMSQSVNEKHDVDAKTQESEAKNIEFETALDSKQTEEWDFVQTIAEETVVETASISVPKGNLAPRFLPGQSELGEPPSTNLTSPEFTKIQRKLIASQKFPCIMNTLLKKSKKVKTCFSANFVLLIKLLRML